jgi:uncharacterized protein (DUF4415 family)
MSKLVKIEMDPTNPPPLTAAQEAELEALARRADDRIDYSDIPQADESFWANARRNPYYRPLKQQLTLRLDADVIAWFKQRADNGRGYQTDINNALRQYVESQQRKAG